MNDMTDSQKERLYILSEECGEVAQMVGKSLRHGYESTHPDGGPTNREELRKEIIDVLAMIHMMMDNVDIEHISCDDVELAMKKKLKYSRYQ